MLLYRLFDIDKEFISYQYEISITKILEEIVSVNIMTDLYFNANLYDLVSILSKYTNKENIIKFILDLDEIYIYYKIILRKINLILLDVITELLIL